MRREVGIVLVDDREGAGGVVSRPNPAGKAAVMTRFTLSLRKQREYLNCQLTLKLMGGQGNPALLKQPEIAPKQYSDR